MKKQSCGHNAYSCASAAGMAAAASSCANFQAQSGNASVSLLDTMMMVSFFLLSWRGSCAFWPGPSCW